MGGTHDWTVGSGALRGSIKTRLSPADADLKVRVACASLSHDASLPMGRASC